MAGRAWGLFLGSAVLFVLVLVFSGGGDIAFYILLSLVALMGAAIVAIAKASLN